MQTLVLNERARVDELRVAVAREYQLLEVRRTAGGPNWQPTSAADPFDWDVPLPLIGAKRFFFPDREVLLRWRNTHGDEAVPNPPPFALFGLRSCDLVAIGYQDQFFATDPYYERRRERALLVGVNCVRACAGGFCREVDAGPFARRGYDLNLTPLPDGRVVVELGSGAGHRIMESSGVASTALDAEVKSLLAAAQVQALASFPKRAFITRAIDRINESGAGAGGIDWAAFGPACFACSGCTKVCPTCSCFTVVDEPKGAAGERVRYWDSCLLEGFQREASGHHPAPDPADRVRRFWYHKLSNDFVADFGRVGCVGCGRCDSTCLGSIGALRVLRGISGGETAPCGAR